MSAGPASASEVESLRRELASLRALVGDLSLRVEALESQAEFSVVGNTRPPRQECELHLSPRLLASLL